MSLVSSLLRMLLGGRGGTAAKLLGGPLLGVVLNQMRKSGGLTGMLDKFRGAGLGQKADSWVGTGRNEQLSADEVERALGSDEIQRIAQETGMTPDQVRARLAEGLPEAVNQVTPQGQVPDEGALGGLIDKLAKFLPR